MEDIESPKMSRLSRLLHRAVMAGRVIMVKSLLWIGANVNAQDHRKRTALHLACKIRYNYTEMETIVKVLLKYGAEVNVQNEIGRTPLHEACLNSNHSSVDGILINGAKISVADINGHTPLHHTFLHEGLHDLRTYYLLLTVNALLASYAVTDSDKMSSQQITYHHDDEEIHALLNLQDNNGNTALHLASLRNNEELVCLLLRKGAKVGIKNHKGMTALHVAGKAHAGNVVNVLVDYGEDVNTKDIDGNTALHIACLIDSFINSKWFDVSTIEKLLNKGAMINERNLCQKTPIEELGEFWSPFMPDRYKYGSHWADYTDNAEKIMEIEKTFMKHIIMMKALKMQVDLNTKWKYEGDLYNEVEKRCCKELDDMKSINVVKDVTLYEVLSHTNKTYTLSTDDLLLIDEFLFSPYLLARFPLYSHSLRTVFQRAKLLTLAVGSFYSERRKSMVKNLPCDVVGQLLTFLSNQDLRSFIKSE